MHDGLFDHQAALDPAGLLASAVALGLDVERFVADAADPGVAARVRRDREEADAGGLSATPSFYLDDEAAARALADAAAQGPGAPRRAPRRLMTRAGSAG